MRPRTAIQDNTRPQDYESQQARTNVLLAAMLEVLLDIRDHLTPVQAEPKKPKRRSKRETN